MSTRRWNLCTTAIGLAGLIAMPALAGGPSDCCFNNGTPGCDDLECETLICGQDSFCCNTSWDQICADAAVESCGVCGAATSNCCEPWGGLGCDDPDCQDLVCSLDPFCCEMSWDSLCAAGAEQSCAVCGGVEPPTTGACCFPDGTCVDGLTQAECEASIPPASDCCVSNGTPGCDNAECEAIVCGFDPFCCNNSWDSICANEAASNCGDLCAAQPGGTYQGDGSTCADNPCGGDVCPESDHNCFTAGGPGCTDIACCELVCSLDPFCCEVSWDGICVDEATTNCDGCGDPSAGDCCAPNGTPYCDDRTCCEAVCFFDAFCCTTEWDAICAEEAAKTPECSCSTCPPSDHNCFTEGLPGCTDVACCDLVCADDPFCCEVSWDGLCVSAATTICDGCGDPDAGNCCEPNGSPYCDNRTCCDLVCAIDSFCCDVAWDGICADEASKFEECACELPPKGTLSLEGTNCGGDAYPDVPGVQIVVELWMRDLTLNATGFQAFVAFNPDMVNYNGGLSSYTDDPFPLHITPIAGAETGEGLLTLDGSDSFKGEGTDADSLLALLVFDVKDECATTMLSLTTSGNFASELSLDGVPIPTNLSGTGPLQLDATPPVVICPENIKVAADVEIQVPGQSICEISNCCAPNGGIGCDNAECTKIVCAFDPFCCDVQWDSICADEAIANCPGSSGGTIVSPCEGAVVEYDAFAEDNCNLASFECVPPSGSFFPIGTTTVTCTAVDKCGNTTSCSFDVTVNATNIIKVEVVLVGSVETDRCIHFVTDDCGVTADAVLPFLFPNGIVPGLDPVGVGEIEVPCGIYEFLCGKDEQHTKWDTVGLVPDGKCWIVAEPLVLRPGDNDNDGDVDINDVTWLVATFGDLAVDGGCPWDGSRDADFNNGGAVQSEDYSLLSAEFLTKTICACDFDGKKSELDLRVALPIGTLPPAAKAADLDRNGVFDWRDVDMFERLNGLAPELSRRMREMQ